MKIGPFHLFYHHLTTFKFGPFPDCCAIISLKSVIKDLLFVLQPVIEFSSVSVPQCLKKFLIYTVGVIKKLSEEGGQSIARNLIWKSGCRVLRTYSYDMRRKKGWHSKMYEKGLRMYMGSHICVSPASESFLKDFFNKLHSSLVTACTE